MRVPSWLGRAAAARPDRTAVASPTGSLTYAELLDAAARAEVPAGERVAIALPPGLDFAVALHACLLAGSVAVPVDARLAPRERALVCAGAGTVIDRPLGSGGRPARPAIGDHDLGAAAVIIHTSGTTGPPRPVALTYGNLLWSALGSAAALGLDPAERWLCPLPLAHVGGLSILVRSAIYATTAVVHPGFDTEAVRAALEHDGITVVSLVPTTLARLLDAGLARPPDLRCALVGGAPLAPALAARALAAGIPVSQTYGCSEACSQVTTQAPGDGRADAGPPLFCTRVRIHDGEIQVCGPTVAPAAGPWLATGDLGELVDGRLRVTGRRADTIVSGGENVAPTEVEAVLVEHAAVAEAAVLGVPDPEWGEAIRALVVLRPGRAAPGDAALRRHCGERLAAFKVPKEFVVVGGAAADAVGQARPGRASVHRVGHGELDVARRRERLARPPAPGEPDGRDVLGAGGRRAQHVEAGRPPEAEAGGLEHRLAAGEGAQEEALGGGGRRAGERLALGRGGGPPGDGAQAAVAAAERLDVHADRPGPQEGAGDAAAGVGEADVDAGALGVEQARLAAVGRREADRRRLEAHAGSEERAQDRPGAEVLPAARLQAQALGAGELRGGGQVGRERVGERVGDEHERTVAQVDRAGLPPGHELDAVLAIAPGAGHAPSLVVAVARPSARGDRDGDRDQLVPRRYSRRPDGRRGAPAQQPGDVGRGRRRLGAA